LRTWCKLIKKYIVHSKLDINVFIKKKPFILLTTCF
jgi:hypothetical protein